MWLAVDFHGLSNDAIILWHQGGQIFNHVHWEYMSEIVIINVKFHYLIIVYCKKKQDKKSAHSLVKTKLILHCTSVFHSFCISYVSDANKGLRQ